MLFFLLPLVYEPTHAKFEQLVPMVSPNFSWIEAVYYREATRKGASFGFEVQVGSVTGVSHAIFIA
jgi:hypothetical protein